MKVIELTGEQAMFFRISRVWMQRGKKRPLKQWKKILSVMDEWHEEDVDDDYGDGHCYKCGSLYNRGCTHLKYGSFGCENCGKRMELYRYVSRHPTALPYWSKEAFKEEEEYREKFHQLWEEKQKKLKGVYLPCSYNADRDVGRAIRWEEDKDMGKKADSREDYI